MATLFQTKAPKIVGDFMRDLSIDLLSSCAIVGNLGLESNGFATLQEIEPTVEGSRGGYGWPQWTGPRRVAYEAWCKENLLVPSDDDANYGYVLVELQGAYKSAVTAVKKPAAIEDKVKAFEASYERAGVKNYPGRIKYAKQALAAYNAAHPAADGIAAIPDAPALVPNAPVTGTAPMPPVTQLAGSSTTPGKEQISLAQQRLRSLGFPEVGNVDGLMGARTIGAIRSAQGYYHLPITGKLDPVTLGVIMDVRTPVRNFGDRADVTAANLKEKAPVQIGDRMKKWGAGVLSFFGLGGLANGTANFDDVSSKVSTLKGLGQVILTFSPWLIGAGVSVGVIVLGHSVIEDYVDRWRTGRTL